MFPISDSIPNRGVPVVNYLIIGANCLVFAFELTLPEPALKWLFYNFGIVPARVTFPAWAEWVGLSPDTYILPFFTSMFLHGGWLHIIGNMWTLWIFGDNVEDRMGPVRYLLFYLLCGLIAGYVHYVFNPTSTIPTVGASGAISGVMGAYFLLFPRAWVVVMVPVFFYPLFFTLPAVVYLFVWFLGQFFSGALSLVAPGCVGGIAWWAHIGGFLAGATLCGWFLDKKVRLEHPDDEEAVAATAWQRGVSWRPGRS